MKKLSVAKIHFLQLLFSKHHIHSFGRGGTSWGEFVAISFNESGTLMPPLYAPSLFLFGITSGSSPMKFWIVLGFLGKTLLT